LLTSALSSLQKVATPVIFANAWSYRKSEKPWHPVASRRATTVVRTVRFGRTLAIPRPALVTAHPERCTTMLGLRKRDSWGNYREVRRYATPSEINSYFHDHHELLFWTALVITGTQESAESSVAEACEDSAHQESVFLDWLGKWAQFAVVRSAVAAVNESIAYSTRLYEGQSCGHGEHPGLSEAEILALRAIEPRVILTDLDPLARSVLILYTLRNTTVYDCVVTLHVPGATVLAAYCRVLRWLRARQSSYAAPIENLHLQAG